MTESNHYGFLDILKNQIVYHQNTCLRLMDTCFRFNEIQTSDVENDTVGAKSSMEMRQERLRARLDQLEDQALAEKPWQMKGEVSASSRPQNSLLEEVVEFDLTTRPGELSDDNGQELVVGITNFSGTGNPSSLACIIEKHGSF